MTLNFDILKKIAECTNGQKNIYINRYFKSFVVDGYCHQYGVYIIVFEDGSLYIGQSKELSKRIRFHFNAAENKCKAANDKLAEAFAQNKSYSIFLLTTDEKGPSEEDFINVFQPNLNINLKSDVVSITPNIKKACDLYYSIFGDTPISVKGLYQPSMQLVIKRQISIGEIDPKSIGINDAVL